MKTHRGKVAVVTGAASGIGLSLARRCAREGMKLVLADIETEPLHRAAKTLGGEGVEVLAIPTDVSKAEEVRELARESLEAFGSVDLLFNNAGVVAPGSIWETSDAHWDWILGVNLWGVLHVTRAFVPRMLEQGTRCHIVNSASVAGLATGPHLGSYMVSKHGVVAFSEALYRQLEAIGSKIRVSVLCPAAVRTRVMDSERNRPEDPGKAADREAVSEQDLRFWKALEEAVKHGLDPDEVADQVFDALEAGRFYILTHPEWKSRVQARLEDILEDRNPTDP